MADLLVYLAGGVLVLWGSAHIAPTKSVASSFGDIGIENRRILVMEWIAEGITHIAVGTLVVCIALLEASDGSADLVYRLSAAVLVALAVLTALTGSRTRVIWFKICPFVLTGAAALLLARSLLA